MLSLLLLLSASIVASNGALKAGVERGGDIDILPQFIDIGHEVARLRYRGFVCVLYARVARFLCSSIGIYFFNFCFSRPLERVITFC